MKQWHIMGCFGMSCICPVYSLLKSTEFHDMWTECQITLVHFLLLISHKLLFIDKCCPLLHFLSDLQSLVAIAIAYQLMVYKKKRGLKWCWWKFIQRREVAWCCWWSLLWFWLQALDDFYSYFFLSLIWEVTNITPGVWKGVIEGVQWQINKFNKHLLFIGRQK